MTSARSILVAALLAVLAACTGSSSEPVARPAPAEPSAPPEPARDPPPDLACERDEDCRVLLLACGCTCFARHVDAPVGDPLFDALCAGRPAQNCGAANPCSTRTAHCDAATHRCALDPQ